jgi:hypothetical protein
MLKSIFKCPSTNKFLVFAAILFSVLLLIEKINGRFWLNDFKVFYSAADAFLSGKQVYGIPFGLDTGYYKYSPLTLLFFTPFTLLPYEIASVLHFILIAISTVSVIIILEKIISEHLTKSNKKHFLYFFVILLCIIIHLVREFHLGNINVILVLLLSLSLQAHLKGKGLKSAILLALVIFTKPYFIICVIPYLLSKKYKQVVYVATSGIALLLLSFLFLGFKNGYGMYLDWFTAMGEHSTYLASNHTIFALLHNYTGISIDAKYGLPALVLASVFIGLLYLRKSGLTTSKFIFLTFLFIALIPNFLITDTEHFLFSLPIITFIVLKLVQVKKPICAAIFTVVVFFYAGNSSDLLGRGLSSIFEDYGFLGLSNLVLIALGVFLFDKTEKLLQNSSLHNS